MLPDLVVIQSMLPSQPQSSLKENRKCFILSKSTDLNYAYILHAEEEARKS